MTKSAYIVLVTSHNQQYIHKQQLCVSA